MLDLSVLLKLIFMTRIFIDQLQKEKPSAPSAEHLIFIVQTIEIGLAFTLEVIGHYQQKKNNHYQFFSGK